MSEIADLLEDILGYSPGEGAKKGEKGRNSPFIRPGENRMDKGFSPNSPNSPAAPCNLNSPNSPVEISEIETIRQWMLDGGRPSNDYLFKLIIEKCEKDEVARKRFVQEAQATKARLRSNAEAGQSLIANEKVVRLAERDYRRYCKDCVFLDRGGYCKQWQKTNPHNSRYRPVPDVLRNCSLFKPKE